MRQLICLLFIICISLTKEATTFAEITITPKSVSGKKVVVTLSSTGSGEGESTKQFTATAQITNVALSDSDSFAEELTCEDVPIGALGDVACTIENAATANTKYTLAAVSTKTATITSTGSVDTITATKLATSEVTAGKYETFTSVAITLTSVSDKSVVVGLTVGEADKDKTTTAAASIGSLSLTDGSSFTKTMTCKIAASSKLSSVTCSIDTAVTVGTKYKLSGTATITSEGGDDFGTVTVDTSKEVAATEPEKKDPNNESSSFGLKICSLLSLFFFLF